MVELSGYEYITYDRTAEAAKEMLGRYFSHDNYHRLHRSIGFITPQQKWEETRLIYDTTAAAAVFSENQSS